MTIIEKILAAHAGREIVHPGEIHDVFIDVRVARDFGGANVVKNMENNKLTLADPSRTFFTFDTNPTGSDQKYATNQQICRIYARKHGIKVYDINSGIGTHLLIDEGLVYSGVTAISTDSHANILGSVGAFGQGMGDKDIAAAWTKGSVWFKIPPSVKLTLKGKIPSGITAKEIVLNLLARFGANELLGYSIEIYGETADRLHLHDRITIASMATEMGAITILFPPGKEVITFCEKHSGKKITPVYADPDAHYDKVIELNVENFVIRVSRPGKPDDTVPVGKVKKIKIDSAFVGSCTNGRIEDMRTVANILKGRKVAPGVVLKIVPTTDKIWVQCLTEGLLKVFKDAGALVSNAGCAGCAAGQVGQNGPGEITISTGNRNFPGKQGRGEVYLASPAVVAASAVAGYITTPDDIPEHPALFDIKEKEERIRQTTKKENHHHLPVIMEGRVWVIERDNIDTDMIFHNRYLTVTDIKEMGQYAFDNLKGYEHFAEKSRPGDIIIAGKNFGAGSSRQQAVDCFKSLEVQAILAPSFGAIYERNAINAAFPVLTYDDPDDLDIRQGDTIRLNLQTGEIENLRNHKKGKINPFSEVQMEIYQNGGLF